ncbi:MAG: hypothetical protein J7J91_03550 [Deltaproteobacteria bacterium]|nr:hypothetical protein [Deltaproteobacteria bacterium]
MENTQGKVVRNSTITQRSATLGQFRSWTVLLIGEQGKIISLRLTRQLIVSLTGLLAVLLSFAVFAVVSYQGARMKNKSLRKEVNRLKAEVAAANKARDSALVRLMVLESEGKKSESPTTQKGAVKTSQAAKIPTSRAEAATEVIPREAKPSPEPQPLHAAQTEDTPESVLPEKVLVENLQIWTDEAKRSAEFQFSLKNIDPKERRIKGYTFVVLNPKIGSKRSARVFPRTSLKNGRPIRFKRGQYFSIARFKFVSGTLTDIETVTDFETATVYVYSENGSLLAQEVYKVDKILRSQAGS